MEQKDKIESVLKRAIEDERLSSLHLAFITSLYHLSKERGFINPIEITRRKIMKIAKIKSFATYHKVILNLIELKYVNYSPSQKPVISSIIEIK